MKNPSLTQQIKSLSICRTCMPVSQPRVLDFISHRTRRITEHRIQTLRIHMLLIFCKIIPERIQNFRLHCKDIQQRTRIAIDLDALRHTADQKIFLQFGQNHLLRGIRHIFLRRKNQLGHRLVSKSQQVLIKRHRSNMKILNSTDRERNFIKGKFQQ